MQLVRAAACLGLLLSLGAFTLPCSGTAVAAGAQGSPVERVVKLLEDLEDQIEKDGKAEEDLYETFVCWGKSIISQKTATNEAAQQRVDMITQYLSDLDGGKIELTTEKNDLTKQVAELTKDIEVAKASRAEAKEDFDEAEKEMKQAIKALKSAINVLGTATKNNKKKAMFLDVEETVESSASERAQEAASLSKAAELGSRVLSPGDAFFLQRLLTGEVPNADWKKLNQKATFKEDYTTRSTKIQSTLAKLQRTFESNLKDAKDKEKAAADLHTKAKSAKDSEKHTAETALASLTKEAGARGEAKQEKQEEKQALESQILTDTKFINQVTKELKDKKTEWKARKALRAGELAAASKAISILRDDDNRDLLSKSHESQGYFFIQEGLSTHRAHLVSNAAETLHAAAAQAGSARLSALALRLSAATGSHFTEVLKAINAMINELNGEVTSDGTKKEKCEADRTTDTRKAIKFAREMDEKSEEIFEAQAKIKEIKDAVKEKQDEVKEIKKDKKAAEKIRDEEKKEYLKAKKDDEDAAAVVKQAKEALEKFYDDNKMSLLQQQTSGRGHAPFVSQAGKAPPPPPSTWEAPYGGKTDESGSIVTMLDIIHADILKDGQKAKDEEEAAVLAFNTRDGALDGQIVGLNAAISNLNIEKGNKMTAVKNGKTSRKTKRGELATAYTTLSKAEPGCDFFLVNYPLRVQNRNTEIDGLTNAKSILAGGDLSFIAEKAAAHKPSAQDGVALVQGRLRAGKKPAQTRLALA